MISQNAISKKGRGGRTSPYVFTEQGIAMLSTVLTSDIAVDVSIKIMDAFMEMRNFLLSNREMMEKLLPFFTRDVIIQHGNRLSKKDALVNKKLVDVVPIIDDNNTPLFDVMGIEEGSNGENIYKVNQIKKVLLHFEDGTVEYQPVVKKDNVINNGAIVEYRFVNKNINYTPEILTFESAYKTLLPELIRSFSAIQWTSSSINQTLGLSGQHSENDKEALLLKESFNEVKTHIDKHLSELLSNYYLVGLDSQAARTHLKNYIIKNREKLLIGLAYMNHWYNIQYNNINVKDYMMKKADFFGKNINSLDQLIRIGGLGFETLKPKNNAVVAGHIIAQESINGNLFTYLEGYRKAFAPDKSNADWFNSATSSKIIEINSKVADVLEKQENQADKTYSNRFYDKLSHISWRHPEIALLLLNLPKNETSMYVLTNMTSTAIGAYGKYQSSNMTNQQVEQMLEATAIKMAQHSDFWYNILPNDRKQDMFRNSIVWDSFGNRNNRMNTAHQQFYSPLSLRIDCQENAGACADAFDVYYVGTDLVGEYGESTYTHELVHVLENTYLLNHGRRNGLGPESYALGLLQSLKWGNQDTLGINSIYDYSNNIKQQPGLQLTNASPERFKSITDLEQYMRNYFDVLYTLDYLEADAVLQSPNVEARNNWFNKMEVKNEGKNITEISRVSAYDATNVEALIDKGFVSRRSYNPPGRGVISYQEGYDAYLEINVLNPIYSSLNNDDVQRNEYEFRKLAFELLAEYGYARGFVLYASNQYAKELVGAAAGYQAFADSSVIQKITGDYATSSAFRKAMFERRKNQLNNIQSIQIIGGNNGYYYGETRNIAGIDELRTLMNEAVNYDMAHNKYSKQALGEYNQRGSRVYLLKAAVLNGFLRATNEFRSSIYTNQD